MSIWIAVLMGILEGLTEFVPVSSTGHLIVAGVLLGLEGEKGKTFEIVIQLGAILAVVVVYRDRFLGLIPFGQGAALRDGARRFAGWRGCWLLFATTAPVLLAGFLLHDLIKERLFGPVTVAWALGIGGLALLALERWRPAPDTEGIDRIGWRQALGVGLFQCLSLWPGVSRSAATIGGGMILRLDRKTSAEFSFFAAVPALAAATGYDLIRSWSLLDWQDLPFFLVGFGVSFLSAWLAVSGFLKLLQRWTLRPFGWYRVAIAPIIYFLVRG